MKKIIVKKITDYNEINLNKCVSWMYDWWGNAEGWTKEKVSTYMKASFNSKTLPQTIIAFNENNEEIGMCQITLKDLDCRPDIYPYIANLYIEEKYRNNGFENYFWMKQLRQQEKIEQSLKIVNFLIRLSKEL